MSVRVIVVGGGAMGLATAWAAARLGATAIVLERFGRGHHEGASHGATRNVNDAYADDAYLALLGRAFELWHALSDPLDESLLRLHGLVTHGDDGRIAGIRDAHERFGVPSAVLSRAAASARWPGFRFTSTALLSPNAGVVRADAALLELERRITDAGGAVRWQTSVASVDTDRVTLADGTVVTGDRVIVTAGAWTRALVPGTIALPPLRVTEEHPAHFAPRTPLAWPSFNHLMAAEEPWPGDVYGMPTPGEGVKVGLHGVGEEVDPDRRPHDAGALAELQAYVRDRMPGLDADTAAVISCTYTSTATTDFILDRAGGIVIGAGFAGHGFKFVPAVGEALARLAVDDAFRADERFRLPG